MTFSEALKQARGSAGMTQTELSKALGVAFSTINRYENGKHFPTPVVLNAIRCFFNNKGVIFEFDLETGANLRHGYQDTQV